MTAGTQQYHTRADLQTLAGNVDLTITAASDTFRPIDPDGSARTVDLIFISAATTGGYAKIRIENVGADTEILTIRDGNNSDTVIGEIQGLAGGIYEWNGTTWMGASGRT